MPGEDRRHSPSRLLNPMWQVMQYAVDVSGAG